MEAPEALDAFTAEWIGRQRWFRAKQRPIATVAEVDRASLPGVAGELRVLEIGYADGGASDRYLLPTTGDREPDDGQGAWTALVRAMGEEAILPGRAGRFDAARTDAFDELVSAPSALASLSERRLAVEQSNTSVVLGDRLILKLYRLLEPGDNPDVEVSAFLTDAGFADTPAVAGTLTYEAPDGERAAAAMLQAFVLSHGDAWAAMLGALAADPGRAAGIAATLGRVTAEMHAALASRPGDPAFPARAATVEETAAWRASAERQLAEAIGALGGDDHDRLVALAPPVRARFADGFGSATGDAQVTRIHGDYHLGQILARRDGGFSVIDFEGEPARPLAERRLPGSPLRDVAGMLRSFDYAARTAAAGAHGTGFHPEAWLAEARRSFLEAYGGIGPGEAGLLDAFELEKACYEVRYEANNRPDWLWLPLAAVGRLSGAGAG
jgi:maltose alpha-D-glucosyltransferase/alpha-amylase